MLSKNKYPWMNRKMRRHPERMLDQAGLNKGWLGGGNFLLAGLLLRGGYNLKAPVSRDDPNFGAQV